MEKLKADIVIIGSGPSGQKAAIQGAKAGKKVIVVERENEPGGSCLFSGTIPSKTFREAIIDLSRFNARRFYEGKISREEVTIPRLNERLQMVIDDEKAMIYRQFRRNNIQLLQGTARFESPHELHVIDEKFKVAYHLEAENFIIATGSLPRNPREIPFDDRVILDSTRLLGLDRVPKSLLVLGGGVIGSEYASFFAILDTEVTIVDKQSHILPMLDSEIGVHLQTALTEIGVKFIGNRTPDRISKRGERAHVLLNDGTELEAEALLFALGRTANVEGLQIEKAGVMLNDKGYVIVNPLFQTTVSHIYAVGDVIGGPCLASTSMEQGRLAMRHIVGAQTHYFPYNYPIGIYTIPEISSCGMTEEKLKELQFNYEVGRAYYYEIARSHIAGTHTGLLKLIFHAETLELLGVHAIGSGATELIHIGQMAMHFNAKIDHFIDQVFNYPTYAETYRVAALNGVNKIKHKS
ncbi:MAG: Si-specific NAD(P)(+) transhydrogenase [Waddliaceae bacterium]